MTAPRRVETASAGETRSLAARLAPLLPAGSLLGLIGDLGAGKTVFVQGLARGLGAGDDDPVRSPSFALVDEHDTTPRLVHADLYRLSATDELLDIGLGEVLADPEAIVAVEWFERAAELELPPALVIRFSFGAGDRRTLELSADDARYAPALEALAG